MRRRWILSLAFLILVVGCFFEPDKEYYEVTLGGAWGSSDSNVYCQNAGSRTYISFDDGQKFSLTTRYSDYVAIMEGAYSQNKANIRIEWDTAKGCWTKECNISEKVYEKCQHVKDSALINRDGRISFRNSFYTRKQ